MFRSEISHVPSKPLSKYSRMRCRTILVVGVCLLVAGFLAVDAAPDTGLHTFYGTVVLIDPAKKIIELEPRNHQRLVFHYNEKTRISSTLGQVNLNKVVRGTAAAVVMRVGEGNAGIATEIRFVPGRSWAQNTVTNLCQNGSRRNHQRTCGRQTCEVRTAV